MLGLSSAGLSAGWVSNYDYTIVPVDKTYDSADGPITTHYLRLAYPNGASETICADGAFSAPVGAPYVVDGTVGNSITVTWPNLTKWTFDYDAPVQKYYLRHIADRMGHAVYVHFDWNHLIDWISDETSGTHLLTFTYYGIGSGFEQALQTISDNHGRVVNFTPRLDPTANIKVLYRVSQVNNASSVRFDYEYVARTLPITGSVPEPFLHQILKPNPAGSNPPLTGVTVNYSTNPDPYTHEYPVTSVVDPNGNSRCYLYNDAYSPLAACRFGGTLIQVKNAQGTVIRAWLQEISYYGLSAGVYDSGRETSVEYNDPGNPLRPTDVSDRNGRYTNYQYDAFGRLIQVTVPSTAAVPPPPMGSGTVWFTSTVYSWTDSPTLGYPYPSSLSVQSGGLYYTDQQLTPTIFTFDPTQTSDPTHDHGLLTMVQWPIPGEVGAREWNQATFHYNGLGDVTQITKPAPTLQPSNTTITYGYASTPERGHPTSITVPLTATTNSVSSLAWNPTGTLASYTDALNHQTTFTYDDALKPLTVTYPPTGSNGSAYAKNTYQYTGGPLAGVSVYPEGTDPSRAALASVNYTYGPYGDLAARTGDTEPCYMTYDALYRLASLADGAGHAPPSPTQPYATTLNYTDSDDQTSAAAQFPLADTYSSSVLHTLTCPQADQFNPVVTNIDGKGVERDLVYDGPNGELTAINYPASAQDDIAYTYDLFDRVCTIRHGASDANYQDYTHYAYDDLGNVTQKDTYYNSGAVSGGISYAYYADGRRASMTTPAGTFNYYYNLAGQLTAMTSPTAGTTSWGYQNNGLLSWQSSGNYYLTSYSYDARGFVTQISNTSSNENLFADFSGISRDALGNITGFTATFPVIDTVSPLPPSPDSTRRPGGGISPLSITPPAPAPTSPYSGTTTYSYAHNSSDTADLLTAYGPVRLEQSTRFSGYTCAYAYDQAFNTTRIRGTGGQTYNSDNQATATRRPSDTQRGRRSSMTRKTV
jgi:YD repeat-containing protein